MPVNNSIKDPMSMVAGTHKGDSTQSQSQLMLLVNFKPINKIVNNTAKPIPLVVLDLVSLMFSLLCLRLCFLKKGLKSLDAFTGVNLLPFDGDSMKDLER